MTKMTYEEWSEKNPIDWDEIEKNDNPDMLITKTGVAINISWLIVTGKQIGRAHV